MSIILYSAKRAAYMCKMKRIFHGSAIYSAVLFPFLCVGEEHALPIPCRTHCRHIFFVLFFDFSVAEQHAEKYPERKPAQLSSALFVQSENQSAAGHFIVLHAGAFHKAVARARQSRARHSRLCRK